MLASPRPGAPRRAMAPTQCQFPGAKSPRRQWTVMRSSPYACITATTNAFVQSCLPGCSCSTCRRSDSALVRASPLKGNVIA